MATFWSTIYQSHFQKYFKKPFDIQVFHAPDGFSLKVATHDWALHGFRVYTSMGLADVLARNEEEDFGEVILFSDRPDKEVPQLFVKALFFILQNAIPLNSRFSICFDQTEPDFAERYGKAALYFTQPAIPDSFFPSGDGKEKIGKETFDKVRKGKVFGRVYQAFFITAEEDAFLDAVRPNAFEQEFRKSFPQEVPILDPIPEGSIAPPKVAAKLKNRAVESGSLEEGLEITALRWSEALSLNRPSCV